VSVEIGGLQVPVSVVIPAAGTGRRVGGGTAKQFLLLRGEPVLVHTVRLFSDCPLVDEIIVVTHDRDTTQQLVGDISKVTQIVPGGSERQFSVQAGVQAVQARPCIVCVHDAARPLLPATLLESVLRGAAKYHAQVVAVPTKDTVKIVNADGVVVSTPPRDGVWSVQTPQVFWVEALKQAFMKADETGFLGTDCSSLVERTGLPVHIHMGSYENIKLTTPEDFVLAESPLATSRSLG
jgi:2-C-methyl-D-erythritol 4-phosphate cytidylyltransferase